MTVKFSLKQLLLGLIVASGVACILPAHAAHAALESDRHAVIYDTVYYDPNASACGGPTGSTGDVTTDIAGKDNAEKIFNYLVDPKRGLTPAQAAGIVGNAKQEHGYQTTDVAGGLGLFQWIGNRRLAAINLATQTGRQPTDIGLQMDYLWQELNTSEKGSLDALKATTSAEDAALSFMHTFERCRPDACNPTSRIDAANWALQTFGNGTSGGVGSGGCAGGANVGCSGATTLNVPAGGSGTAACYFNQGQIHTNDNYDWGGCGCLPTSTLIIRATLEHAPTLSASEVLNGVKSKDGVAGDNCSGVITGAVDYLKSLGYTTNTILPERGTMTDSTLTAIKTALSQGNLVLTHSSNHVDSQYASGTIGHFLVIYAVDAAGNFYVANPGARADSPIPNGKGVGAGRIKDWLDMAIAVKK